MDHSEMKKSDSDSSGSASGDGSGSDDGGGRRNKGNEHQHCPSAPEYDISLETEHLHLMCGGDFQIVSDPFPQVTIKIRPLNERVSATLLVSCFRGYPSKCPELMIKSTEGLSKDDRDNLLSQLRDQANAHASKGRPMICDLVMAAQDSLSDIDVTTSYLISRYKEDFEEITQLGSGAFGHAVLSKNKLDGRQYAIKKIRLDDKSLKDRILREVVTLSRLQHRHVVRYYQAWFETGAPCPFAETTPGSMTPVNSNSRDKSANSADMSMHKNELDQMRPSASSFGAKGANLSESIVHEDKPETTYLCIQMEYCKRTLHDMFQSYNLDEELAWRLFGQIVEGLTHIHGEGIIHRDLTPKNIFLDDHDDVKIGDFGLAEFSKLDVPDTNDDPVDTVSDDPLGDDPPVDDDLEDTSDDAPYGTSFYMAPEIKKESNIDEKVDIYSLGVVFFELWHPFHAQMERAVILDKLKNERELPSSWVAEFPEQASLLKQLISPNPSDRPSAADILHLPFSSNMKSESLYRL